MKVLIKKRNRNFLVDGVQEVVSYSSIYDTETKEVSYVENGEYDYDRHEALKNGVTQLELDAISIYENKNIFVSNLDVQLRSMHDWLLHTTDMYLMIPCQANREQCTLIRYTGDKKRKAQVLFPDGKTKDYHPKRIRITKPTRITLLMQFVKLLIDSTTSNVVFPCMFGKEITQIGQFKPFFKAHPEFREHLIDTACQWYSKKKKCDIDVPRQKFFS